MTAASYPRSQDVRRDVSREHLLGRLAVLELRVRAAVEDRRTAWGSEDPFRGLYISDEDVDALLGARARPVPAAPEGELRTRVERQADAAEAGGARLRLRGVATSFGLEGLDVELLLAALAPDLDARFERLYGYLHDDVTRRRASVGLALELAGESPVDAEARFRLAAGAPLLDGGLVVVGDDERPFLTRSLCVPDRVAAHLLGDDHVDPVLLPFLAAIEPWAVAESDVVATAIAAGCRLVYIREKAVSGGRALAAAAFARLGRPVLAVDFTHVAGSELGSATRAALREARLADAALVAGPVENLGELDVGGLRGFADAPWTTVLTGSCPWDPRWSRDPPLVLEPSPPGPGERARMWQAALDGDLSRDLDPAGATSQFRLGPEQVARAARVARLRARSAHRLVEADDLRAGARGENAAGLDRLARRVRPQVGWDDLVLRKETRQDLHELAARAVHRERVRDEWHVDGARGRGITALFAGESGTGKTMAAEVLAGDLGLDLYAIDLATVVDKYVGETEKNLDRIFREAEHVCGVLFFDEADALFGKRSEVRDAHDRYANVETAYLLQRMESFDGIAILATNLRANIDEAFMRRLDVLVHFPLPDEGERRRLWDRSLGPIVPRADDLDLDFCARAFELSGGNVRNIALTAAYAAAAGERAVAMEDLIRATRREYGKLGRICGEKEFGPYYRLVAP